MHVEQVKECQTSNKATLKVLEEWRKKQDL